MLIWTLTDGAAGALAQTRGLAGALAADGDEIVDKTVAATGVVRALPALARSKLRRDARAFGDDLAPPWPDIAVSCGAAAAAIGVVLKSFGVAAVHIQRPPCPIRLFDAVVIPEHDRRTGRNVVPVLGSLGEITRADMTARRAEAVRRFSAQREPRLALLIGGGNRAYQMDETDCRDIARRVARAASAVGAGVMATASRRSVPDAARVLTEGLGLGRNAFVWDGAGDNPYRDMLAAADAVVATCDSVNMLSEACSTGKPVLILSLPLRRGARRAAKFARFHRALVSRGLARHFSDKIEFWEPPPLDETSRAAAAVRELITRR